MSTIDTDPPDGTTSLTPDRATGGATGLPTGTVTFLFTDIEGSTRLLQRLGERYGTALEQHRHLIRQACEEVGGRIFGSEGDALFAVFSSAPRAVLAAVNAQRALALEEWPDGESVKVRMGVHTGEAALVGGDYVGIDLHRVARITAAGHGGQVLLSASTQGLVDQAMPDGVTTRDLGERRLKDLSRPERIYQVVIPGLAADFPTLRTLDATPNNLPTQLTSFIGRGQEVTDARRLLATSRLLTLTGPGGTGKTRLSLQIAADEIEAFSDGVFFVPLAAITDPELVPSAIAEALGLKESGQRSPLERLAEHLRDRRLLLVLDNFEQVVPAAPSVNDLLRAAPGLKIIVTSRAILHLYGEQEFQVPPLGLPPIEFLPPPDKLSQFEAVKLFIERAMAVRPNFGVTNDNAPAVAQICARLDGLPLAIELAAARIRLLTPQAILTRLEHRLSLLASGMRDLPERQQTLRGAIAWSHDLLGEPDRRLFGRASVFVGGFDLEGAEAVCGPADELGMDVLDGLASLVDQSLVRREETDGEPRFLMLETIREFATERLVESGKAEEIARRHAAVYVALAERARPELLGSRQKGWLDRLERDNGNLRAALGWAIEQDAAETACRLSAALWRFWQIRGHLREGRAWLERVVALPHSADHPRERAMALEAAGGVAYWQSDFDAAERYYSGALELQRQMGDRSGIANALYNLSFAYQVPQRDLALARSLLEESLGTYRDLGDRAGMAKVEWALSSAALAVEDYHVALGHNLEGLAIFRELDDRFSLGWALHSQGIITMKLGDLAASRAALEEGIRLFAGAGDVSGVTILLDDFSALAGAEGDFQRAACLSGAAASLQTSSGTDLAGFIAGLYGQPRPDGAELAEESISLAWTKGREMSIEQAVSFALAPPATLRRAAEPVGPQA